MPSNTSDTPFPLGAFPNTPDSPSFLNDYNTFTAEMGTAPAYLDYFGDPSQAVSNWVNQAQYEAGMAAGSLLSASAIPVFALPMYSNAGGDQLNPDAQYQAISAGQMDATLIGIVQAWANAGFKSLVIRPGWEMNLEGQTYAGDGAQTQADWVAAFQHIYTTLHQAAAAAGISLSVVWNPGTTSYSNAEATTSLYPGDAYVDAIGADVYADAYPFRDSSTGTYYDFATGASDATTAAFMADPVNRIHYWNSPAATHWLNDTSGGHSQSLSSLIQFAGAHGKSFAIPETGAGNADSGNDVVDDPAFPAWLAGQLAMAQNEGTPISFVNIWDSGGGGDYEWSNTFDDKPLEATAWARYFGVQGTTNITSIPVVILGAGPDIVSLTLAEDAWQGDAQVTLAVDGIQIGGAQTITASQADRASQIINLRGNWGAGHHIVTVNFINDAYGGSAASDRNAYVTSASYDQQVAAGASLALSGDGPQSLFVGTFSPTTTVLGTGLDAIDIKMSEDAYQGDGQFTISVDGTQIGGTQTVQAYHALGQKQDFLVEGNWGAGSHTVAVNFLNDLYGGGPLQDRNIYVDSATYDLAPTDASLALFSNGQQTFQASVSDTLVLQMAEDAWQGDAQFTVSVDGAQVGGIQTATASHAVDESQAFTFGGNWGSGLHTVSVDFLNDAYGGSAAQDRNLYVSNASFDGTTLAGASLALLDGGSQTLVVGTFVPTTVVGSGADTIDLQMSEDAFKGDCQFTISVDGIQIGGTQTVQALHALGQDQAFLVQGTWSTDKHTVAVNFLNDLYEGGPLQDRNIYVDSATYDGVAVTAANLDLLADGAQTFQVSLTDNVVLEMAEDAWQGDAQFTVSVDGTQVGGTRTVTASHAAGMAETFTLGGNWGEGAHTVSVDFLNDAYGSPSQDRNLYVNRLTLDGTSFTENAALLNSGSQAFNVVTSKTYAMGNAGGSVTTVGNDIVTVGAGAVTVNANGPAVNVTGGPGSITFIAHNGSDTITAGSGSITATASSGALTFTQGSSPATVTLGSGKGVFDFINGHAGGSLLVNDFTPGFDVLHLQGYAGITSEQVIGGATQIELTDNTMITLTGVTDLFTKPVFG